MGTPIFQRSRLEIPLEGVTEQESFADSGLASRAPLQPQVEQNVLVVNASTDMAQEITKQLMLEMPGCSLMYAPSVELAKWILHRRKIHLVVSSALLPDGSIMRLQETLPELENPPAVVVVGDLDLRSAEMFQGEGYDLLLTRRLGRVDEGAVHQPEERIAELGADLRNDLNNPLQEIVAMVFVAQASNGTPEVASHALHAIDRAAKNMANVVSRLEDKIRSAVASA